MSQIIHHKLWLQAVLNVAKHYRIDVSAETIRLELDWNAHPDTQSVLTLITRQLGMSFRQVNFSDDILNPWQLPLIVELKQGQIAVIDKIDAQGQLSLQFSSDEGLTQVISTELLKEHIQTVYIVRPEKSIPDARVDEYIQPFEQNWFWQIVLKDWKRYIDIMFASSMANILALASVLFSMNVYDRVIPAQSVPTLWVLAGGVLLAAVFEFSIRIARLLLSDILGKRADLKISDRVFGHALRIKNKERSKSTGTFISQIRELEGVRDLVTSSTISAIADLPFFLLFLAIFWIIGGNLFWVILLVVPLMLLPAILIQKPLAKLAKEGMRESAIRNAMLVEAVQGIEDIKLLRAESRFQNQWNHMNEVSADISKKQRKLVGITQLWTQKIQGISFAIVVLVGCFAVMDGEMTTGALVACSILSSRMLGPIAQITGILGRLQQAKIAKKGLDELMKRPVDQPEYAHLIHKPAIRGQFELKHVTFKYQDDDENHNLAIAELKIKPGEKVAILGRNGAGKSTLLQLLAGMQEPNQGKLLLDGIDLGLIDPADVRRDVGLLNQHAHLFFGTVRENLKLGAPLASDDDMFKALKMTGAIDLIESKKQGLDYQILEGGTGLSGGQRQALVMARLLIRQPNVLLLDEPTSALDEVTEQLFIQQLKKWLGHRTLLIATHRRAVLELVDRIIVINDGKIIMDGTKEQVLNPSHTQTHTANKAQAVV